MPPPKKKKYDQNFVSQDQINSLLKGSGAYGVPDGEDDPLGDIADFINTDEIDRLLGDDDPEDETEPPRENAMSDEPLPDDDGSDDDELSLISMDDIQRVLSEDAPGDAEATLELDELPLEEIMEVTEGDASDGEGDLISQDDIDRLLKNSGVQVDEFSAQAEAGFGISREEMDTILIDTREEASESEDALSIFNAVPGPTDDDDDILPEKPRSKKKWILIAAGFLLLFICGGGAGWYFLLRGGETAGHLPLSGGKAGGSPNALAPGEPQVVSRLDNFLIPAAEGNDYAFVSMDLVITIRGVKTDPIKGYETFYRKRLFDELAAKLAGVKGEKPVEHDLKELVRKTAGALLTEGVIGEVALDKYRLM